MPVASVPSLPVAVAVLPAATVAKPISTEKYSLATNFQFDFGHGYMSNKYLQHDGKKELDRVVSELKSWKTLKHVQIIGHADHLRLDKNSKNKLIALQRTEQIVSYLISHGIPAGIIEAKEVEASQPVVTCSDQRDYRVQKQCLQPNRRVEVIIEGIRK